MTSTTAYTCPQTMMPNWNANRGLVNPPMSKSLSAIHSEYVGKTLSIALNDHLNFLTERVTSVFLCALKDNKAELKSSIVNRLTQVLTPIFINQPFPDLPDKYKAMILAAIEGIESFFEDLDHALASKKSYFETNNMLKLQHAYDDDAFEDEIIDKMNIRLQQKHFQTVVSLPHDEQEMENKLCNVTTNLLKSLFPSVSKKSLEHETIMAVAGLYLSKTAGFIFSSFTMLHLMDKFLNPPPTIDNKITKFPLSFPDTPIDMKFANSLDERFHKLFKHVLKLGAAEGLVNQFLFAILTRFIPYLIKGAIGKGCAKAMQATARSPSSASILAWSVDLFYRDNGLGKAKNPVLLSSITNRNLTIHQYKFHIEKALIEHRLFEKVNGIIKNVLSDAAYNASSNKKLLYGACGNVVVDSTTIKSLCDSFTRKLYILFQRERLLKMLYCYMAEYTRKAISSEHQ